MRDQSSSAQSFSVVVTDMAHYGPGGETIICGFPTLEEAADYARRRTRDSLEELRTSGQSGEELRRLWWVYGEDASVPGHYAGNRELDYFIANPATPEERDWLAIEKRIGGLSRRAGRE